MFAKSTCRKLLFQLRKPPLKKSPLRLLPCQSLLFLEGVRYWPAIFRRGRYVWELTSLQPFPCCDDCQGDGILFRLGIAVMSEQRCAKLFAEALGADSI